MRILLHCAEAHQAVGPSCACDFLAATENVTDQRRLTTPPGKYLNKLTDRHTRTFGWVHQSLAMTLEDLNSRKVFQSQPLDAWGSSDHAPSAPCQCTTTLCICQTATNYHPIGACEFALLLSVFSSRQTG